MIKIYSEGKLLKPKSSVDKDLQEQLAIDTVLYYLLTIK